MQAQDVNAATPFAAATGTAGYEASAIDALFKDCFPEYASGMDMDLVTAAAVVGLARMGAPVADAMQNGAYASTSAGGAAWFPPADMNLLDLLLTPPSTSLPTVHEEDKILDGLPELDQASPAMDEDDATAAAQALGQRLGLAVPAPVTLQHVFATPAAPMPAAAATLPYPEKMIARDAPINLPRGANKRSHTQMTEAELAHLTPEERKAYEKRRNNTISARESRARKQAKVDHLEKTSTELLARCAALEQELALYKAKYGPLMH
ncbi:hypothetical protein AMAG_12706 [Allomyces macrogynus ATCC 38327]|uniref:BZIP domain-containing protein n=1 Tax=Allomyces macrogynus (strain ATCC 38327) TaxID=578462 RepID=A0A0L0T151_ALLM3|nr:hypothetical protein AMAG_12706 [Allomyces macrogynus ATCC 38327]|eukprot:KNE68538.1 hypothetical protein AMAG_12706 [Allomyces macrogynus ATCC 38327]